MYVQRVGLSLKLITFKFKSSDDLPNVKRVMYIDTEIVASIIIVLAMVIGAGWIGLYAFKYINRDAEKNSEGSAKE